MDTYTQNQNLKIYRKNNEGKALAEISTQRI